MQVALQCLSNSSSQNPTSPSACTSTPRRASAVAVDRKRVVAAASVELPPGAVTDVGVAEPDQLSEALRELFNMGDFGRRVYLGLSVRHGVVRLLDMPLIEGEAEREAAVRFQAAEAIAMPLEEAILDYAFIGQTVDPPAGPRMQVVLAAARRAPVLELVDAVNAAGLKPLGVELEPFALVRALGEPAQENEVARLYVHLGASNAILAIAIGHTCMFTRSAPQSRAPGWSSTSGCCSATTRASPARARSPRWSSPAPARTATSRSTRWAFRMGSPSASPRRSESSRSPPAARMTSVT